MCKLCHNTKAAFCWSLAKDGDDARLGKQNKTPKCLFSTTQARGRK
jgi:hypothetical protein